MAKEKTPYQIRQEIDDIYRQSNVEPTDGFRSRLEALWVAEFEGCSEIICVECTRVPLWITGPYGKFLSNYNPDITVESKTGDRTFVELKPTTEMALTDDRPTRALELNPHYKFVVIGGYPYQGRGVTVRLLTGTQEKVYKQVSVPEVLKFLGCGLV